MNRFKFLVFLLLFIEFPTYSSGQSTGVSCSFISDTVVVGYGQTFSNKIRFENKTSQAITLFQSTTTADVLLRLPDTIRLSAGAIVTYPVKYFASSSLLSVAAGEIKATYINQFYGQKLEAFFVVKINQSNKIFINLPEPVVYLNNVTGLANFKLHCANRGFSATHVNLKLIINTPGIQVVTPIRDILLDAGSDKMIEFEAKLLNGNANYSTNYNITIECTDDDGNSLATSTLQIAEIGNNKREQAPVSGQYFNQLSNTAELSYTSINQSCSFCSFYSLLANGNIAPNANSHLSYNFNINYYDKQSAFDGYNTWVNYNNKHFGITAGNLMENLDYFLFGRGAKASVFLDKHNSFDLYYVQNSYVLFSQLLNPYPGSTVFAGSYNFNYAGNVAKVSLLYSRNPLTGVNTHFTNGFARIALKGNQRLEVKAGYSNEQEPSIRESHNGAAAGFIYSYRSPQWDLSLNNYYSTAYYSGLQRGTTQLDNFLNYHITSKTSILGHYELIKNSPKYLVDTLTLAGFYNNTLKYELGLNFNFKSLNLNLHPYWFKQDINQTYSTQYIQVSGPLSSKSIRTGFDINYTIGQGQQITALTDFGYTRSDNPQLARQHYMGFRINTNYFNKWWGLSVLLQNAPYYLAEEIATTYSNPNQQYHNYSIGPNIHFTAFNNRLSVSANDYLNFTSYAIKRNNALSGQVYYRLKGGWQLSGQVFYNSYPSYVNSYNLQTRVGVSKQFIRTSTPGTHSLQLQLFEDENNDGVFNNNDKVIEGLVINITSEKSANNSDLTTISNKNGIVKYINLQNSVYSLSVVRGNGWHLGQTVKINLVHNQKMMVPLVKSGWLKGIIIPVKQKYTTNKPNLEGLRVIAIDDKSQTFSTLTNEFGEFEFALPVNSYHVTVELDNQKFSVNNPDQIISIDQKIRKEVTFNIVDQAHKVIVKQF